ncbi:MAG: hypothetical protein ABIN89_17910 [Chitinophagaceae bacterium]
MPYTFKLLFIILFVFCTALSTIAVAQQKKIVIQVNATDEQLAFAGNEIIKATKDKGYIATITSVSDASMKDGIIVSFISDSSTSIKTVKDEKLKTPKDLGWQSYSIRVKVKDKLKTIYILAADKTGAMYGGFDIAEAINLKTIDNIKESDNKPYIDRRGIKFNIPLDLRTPSYSDMSDAGQQNIPVMWDMDFWQQQLDAMALNRYNVLSLWNLHPFPSLVKVPEFPEVALQDVWRTKAKIHDHYSLNGDGYVTPELLANHEVIKTMSIDEKIAFWKKVMTYAKNRGIEVYWFTWNIFTYGAEGKSGITDKQDNDTTIAYFRATVREMVLTYPDLAGIGITAGEHMQGSKSKYSNEQWLGKTYGQGISDALVKQPNRQFRLIHRFHQTNLKEIQDAFKDYPGPFDLSLKYAIAHMYGIPNPPFVKPAMTIFSSKLKTWLTLRNDDIYSFRWGNNSFARRFILSIPEPEKVAGYYMGPDGYTWGKDFLDKNASGPGQLIIQKQWYSFMLWGRLGFDPSLNDAVFYKTVEAHFPGTDIQTFIKSWSAASMIFPWITRLSWGDVDFKWFPEANISRANYKGFYTVRDLMEVDPEAGSRIRNIVQWAQNYKSNSHDTLLSPLAVADSLSGYASTALANLKKLPARKPGVSSEWDYNLGDIEAFATIGNYYAEKIRGASSLALFNFNSQKKDQDDAIKHLSNAKAYWIKYAAIYSSQYKPALYNRIGNVDVTALTEKTENDINIAKNWVPGTIKEYQKKTQTEVPFRN